MRISSHSINMHSTTLYRVLPLRCSPAAAAREAVSVCEGDIILVATDGLFDNLHESAIIELCAPLLCSHSQSALQRELQRVADALVRRALELSEDPAYVSPFALEAREHGLDALGGALCSPPAAPCRVPRSRALSRYRLVFCLLSVHSSCLSCTYAQF